VQTSDLIKTIDQCSDEELLERLRKVRHNREVARPVAVRKTAKVETKTARKRVSAVDKVVDTMSESERQKLIELLLAGG
jgi:hypothetical protein